MDDEDLEYHDAIGTLGRFEEFAHQGLRSPSYKDRAILASRFAEAQPS